MERKHLLIRLAALPLILAGFLVVFVLILYDLQITKGEAYAEMSVRNIAVSESVNASRGEILDSYGRVLVSNRTTYQVTLNTSLMGDDRNDTIARLIQVCREEGVEWKDSLTGSLSDSVPLYYTVSHPFASRNGETGEVTLTRLGRLAVADKWLEEDEAKRSASAAAPLSPAQLLNAMRETFQIDGTLSDNDARALAGVLYDLELRRREVLYDTYVFAEDVDIRFISRVKELGLIGVEVEATSVREYHTRYAAHLLGRVGPIFAEEWESYKNLDRDGDGEGDYQMDDIVGRDGAERAFEEYLRGTDGVRLVEQNTTGKTVSQTWQTKAVPGANVSLTIDSDLQQVVEDVLARGIAGLASKTAEGGAVAIVKVDDGSIPALASYPTYDLSSFNEDYTENMENPLHPFVNRAVQGLYAPGSTFKPVTAIAGLEEPDEDGKPIITPTTKILDTGIYNYYGPNGPRCWIYSSGRTHGLQNVTQAITNSCNVFFYDVGRRVGIERLQKYASMFGLGQKTGLEEGFGEVAGVMAGPEYTEAHGGTWYDGNTLSVAIGQESSQFTPLQLANYIATLVNGGTRYQTHLLKSVKSYDFSEVLYEHEPVVLDTIEIDPENLDAVKAGMLDLTTTGSVSRYFAGLDFRVGAKTGTAQVSATSPNTNAVFVCFAPYEDPEIAMAIVVEKGGSGAELGSMAAEILKYYFSAADSQGSVPAEGTLIR